MKSLTDSLRRKISNGTSAQVSPTRNPLFLHDDTEYRQGTGVTAADHSSAIHVAHDSLGKMSVNVTLRDVAAPSDAS